MEENKTRKLRIGGKRKTAVEVPLLNLSNYPHDDKGNAIVPDAFFSENLKQLPNGTYNESKTYRAYNGGKLYQIGSDPNKDKEITTAGANASNTTQAQRKSFAEMFIEALPKKDDTGLSHMEKIVLGQMIKAEAGDTKAAVFVRDTIGEMPVSKQQISADITTEADRALMEKITKRLQDQDK
jgi:hypothetical protein